MGSPRLRQNPLDRYGFWVLLLLINAVNAAAVYRGIGLVRNIAPAFQAVVAVTIVGFVLLLEHRWISAASDFSGQSRIGIGRTLLALALAVAIGTGFSALTAFEMVAPADSADTVRSNIAAVWPALRDQVTKARDAASDAIEKEYKLRIQEPDRLSRELNPWRTAQRDSLKKLSLPAQPPASMADYDQAFQPAASALAATRDSIRDDLKKTLPALIPAPIKPPPTDLQSRFLQAVLARHQSAWIACLSAVGFDLVQIVFVFAGLPRRPLHERVLAARQGWANLDDAIRRPVGPAAISILVRVTGAIEASTNLAFSSATLTLHQARPALTQVEDQLGLLAQRPIRLQHFRNAHGQPVDAASPLAPQLDAPGLELLVTAEAA